MRNSDEEKPDETKVKDQKSDESPAECETYELDGFECVNKNECEDDGHFEPSSGVPSLGIRKTDIKFWSEVDVVFRRIDIVKTFNFFPKILYSELNTLYSFYSLTEQELPLAKKHPKPVAVSLRSSARLSDLRHGGMMRRKGNTWARKMLEPTEDADAEIKVSHHEYPTKKEKRMLLLQNGPTCVLF